VETQLQSTSMLPEGTEVYYKGMYAHIRFACEQYMTVCIREFPNERVRDVCLVIYPSQYDILELVNGNHAHEL
jgi:hypothetical protein